MNKKELVDYISKSSNLSKTQATDALKGTLDAITNSLKNSEKVTLVGFGTFSTSKRGARTGRNPQNGKSINIPAKTFVKFKAGKAMGNDVDNEQTATSPPNDRPPTRPYQDGWKSFGTKKGDPVWLLDRFLIPMESRYLNRDRMDFAMLLDQFRLTLMIP